MKSLFKTVLKVFLAAIAFHAMSINTALASEEIDVLFLYEPAITEHYNGNVATRINHIVETTNAIYQASHLDIQINAVEAQQYDFDDKLNAYELIDTAKNSSDIADLRDRFGADLVVIYRLYRKGQPCGLGYRPAAESADWTGLSYVAIDCATYKTAHEIGHNMGLAHSYAQGSEAFLPYARGHGVEGKFATIMAYSTAYNAPKVYKFSSTEYDCNGVICGLESGEEQANAVKALRHTAAIVANLRAPATQQCDVDALAIVKRIKMASQVQQAKVSDLDLSLIKQKALTYKSQMHYQQVMQDYVQLITKAFQPVNKKYQTAKNTYVTQLAAYRQGKVSRKQTMASYHVYKSAREALIVEQNKIKDFHKTQYLVAYNKMQSNKRLLSELQMTYKLEERKATQLMKELEEAKTIYHCA